MQQYQSFLQLQIEEFFEIKFVIALQHTLFVALFFYFQSSISYLGNVQNIAVPNALQPQHNFFELKLSSVLKES